MRIPILSFSVIFCLVVILGCGDTGGGGGGNPLGQSRDRGARAASEANLKQIGLAMHNYAATHNGQFPPWAHYNHQGQPTLSWRVLILPELGQNNLFRMFRLNEAWDSPSNMKALKLMPKFYRSQASRAGDTMTHYRIFTGPQTPFPIGPRRQLRLSQLTNADGAANTVLVVESAQAVPWTKPEEFVYANNRPLPKLGGLYAGSNGFLVVMADTAVHFVRENVPESTIRLGIAYNDGRPFPGW